ncbi:polysaccharide deacetylase family protein [Thalassotalea sp. 1_MG-2023]|uniref:polysaccharide deacetylase family protein n=1 Tax=Thalassotalea sp. 1_MG-2023 TaxID=3062680 RepID=UPI0026E395AC|nr:polysaccharide deacetylase family protein [Thalassotalea sp. 1_MG-2023]MDO6425493.1 polysaccharide deacetylase family protein [Thalassotalea sp. 1_MG-2023]
MLNWLLKTIIKHYSKGRHGNKLNILTYHRVDEFEDPLNPTVLSVKDFHNQLRWLKKHFVVLSIDEALSLMEAGKLPFGAVCLTIDDGYNDSYHHIFRLLKEEGLVANFFIATGGIESGALWDEFIRHAFAKAPVSLTELSLNNQIFDISTFNQRLKSRDIIIEKIKYMTLEEREVMIDALYKQTGATKPQHSFLSKEQIKEMHDNGMIIGGHTHNHPILAVENKDVVDQQIMECHGILESIIGEKVKYFAFPNGKLGIDFREEHSQLLKNIGIKAALSTDWGTLENLTEDRYRIKRFTPWDDTKWRFCIRLAFNYRN